MYVITGASRGVGNFLCGHLASRGEPVVGTYHATVPAPIQNVRFDKVDVSSSASVAEWIASLEPELRDIKLINCAGINYTAFAHKADLAQWEGVVRTNLFGTFYTIRALLPIMRKQGYGRIVNFGSVVAQTPMPGTSAYAASKSALWGLAKSLAAENGKLNITVNNLNVGYSELGMIREVSATLLDAIKARIPSGRLAVGEEIAAAVDFLVQTPYVNGVSIDLSGGLV